MGRSESDSLATRYREAMRRHRYGYALYEPAPFERLRPGMLGFLDEYQRWHPVLDLADAAAVTAAGFEPPARLQRAEPDVRRFGPLTASGVKETSITLEAGAGAAALGLPVQVSGALEYSSSGDFGAVLMCDADVVSEGFDFRDPFSVWLRAHAGRLFARYPEAREHGLCAATWTYSSTDVHITAWHGTDKRVVVGFDADVAGAAKAGPKTTWHRGSSSVGWSSWTGQKRVVFFTGVKIRPGLFGVREQHESRWRGSEFFFADDDKTQERYRVGLELIGDEWHQIMEDEGEEAEEEQEEE
ncbi:hypothetical protein VTH06DRAFT_4937 [Thermothelomyces fergusii]